MVDDRDRFAGAVWIFRSENSGAAGNGPYIGGLRGDFRGALLSGGAALARLASCRSIKHVSVPVFYPQNIIAWSHIRHSAMNVGQSFYRRILVFTTFFGIFVFGSVAYSFVLLAMNSSGVDTLIVSPTPIMHVVG